MISVDKLKKCDFKIVFVYEDESINANRNLNDLPEKVNKVFYKKYKTSIPFIEEGGVSLLYVGLGEKSKFSFNKIKDIVAYSIKQIKKYEVEDIAIDISMFLKEYDVRCITEVVLGINLGLYELKNYKTSKKQEKYNIFIQGYEGYNEEKIVEEIRLGTNISDGVMLARDLVNTPANMLTPIIMAETIASIHEDTAVDVEVFDENYIKDIGMEAFYTVGKSSGNPPRLIVLRYLADPSSKDITALVGKGVTCDTGGYCLKPSNSMEGIKGDMAGGAAVAGAIYSLAKNNVKANVVGVIPASENRISRESFIPGDVIGSMSGKTIEVLNTDAEGRLILADAVTYAIQKEGASKIIDIATLTGSVVNALGFSTAGVLTNNDKFFKEFKEAYNKSGEQYWRFPICDEHRDMIKSNIADIKNMGKSYCGTITAGLFIEEFVENMPWIHLDIAGTAWVDTPLYEYQSKGATGAGVTSMYYLFLEKE
ncbi:leucyl aminopeptidase [Clostridium algidicarnis]|uniref:leucyl aminopeptidase n=1 Tax=Clostridium algidicarnis TaxID=37659 RepID=UPI001C0B0224|nr:leucyl aminopeptidase [Clostridium algidicarnis]MBU3204418.1 leucyl aminopeptidase [Clostridium algidicarnis]MBU3212499.1 leucyl aminopeptidase [Clostridium algidicarnis]MBU3222930.1 leucyl aminopeptidase [Clostridium algidicarnis]